MNYFLLSKKVALKGGVWPLRNLGGLSKRIKNKPNFLHENLGFLSQKTAWISSKNYLNKFNNVKLLFWTKLQVNWRKNQELLLIFKFFKTINLSSRVVQRDMALRNPHLEFISFWKGFFQFICFKSIATVFLAK